MKRSEPRPEDVHRDAVTTVRRDVAVIIDPQSPVLRRKDVVRQNERDSRRRHERRRLQAKHDYKLARETEITRRALHLIVSNVIIVLILALMLVAVAWIMGPVLVKSPQNAFAFTAGIGSVLTAIVFGWRAWSTWRRAQLQRISATFDPPEPRSDIRS